MNWTQFWTAPRNSLVETSTVVVILHFVNDGHYFSAIIALVVGVAIQTYFSTQVKEHTDETH